MVLPTSCVHYAGQGTSRSLECACASSLQHSALSLCSKHSTGQQQCSPGRMGFSLSRGIALQPRCKSAVRYGRQPTTFRAARITFQVLRIRDPYQHSLCERLSSTTGVLGRPTVREVLKRPDGGWFRTPSLGNVLVLYELPVTVHVRRLPNCHLLGTDLAGLRDELARALTPAWCGWSSARVSSACRRRWHGRLCT